MDLKEPAENIITLCKSIKECIRLKRTGAVKHYIQELNKTVHDLEIEEPIFAPAAKQPDSKDTNFKEVINDVEKLCLKVLAAVKMGRDDIATNYLYVVYDKVHNLKSKLPRYFDEGKEYIN